MLASTFEKKRLKIGVSACLLGERVRYDGGHKRSELLLRSLASHYQMVPVCPEAGAGLGVPRPPVHLVRSGGVVRAVGVADERHDVTAALIEYGERRAAELADLCGFVFKSRSPSCGWGTTPIRNGEGGLDNGNGLFAQMLVQAWPRLPVIDEEALGQSVLRQRFLQQVEEYALLLD